MLNMRSITIVERWSALLPDCAEEGPGLLELIEQNLIAFNIQDLSWKEDTAATSLLTGLMGRRRNFLMIRNGQLPEWRFNVGAHTYGSCLSVVWYMTISPSLWSRIRAVFAKGFLGAVLNGTAGYVSDLDLFGEQDLSSYKSCTLMAVQDAVDELVRRRELDLEQLNRKTSGLFAVA